MTSLKVYRCRFKASPIHLWRASWHYRRIDAEHELHRQLDLHPDGVGSVAEVFVPMRKGSLVLWLNQETGR